MGQAIDTLPPVSAIHPPLGLSQIAAVDIGDVVAHGVRHRQQLVRAIDMDSDRRTDVAGDAQWSAFMPAAMASVSNWSSEEKYCVRSRRMSCGN